MQRPPSVHRAILVVDDDDVNRDIATMMLRVLGYENVTTAANGQDAVTACEHCAFDLVLMDCEMPVLNGLDATRMLRASGLSLPVVAFTATATPQQKALCLEAGMTDFLPKPASLAALGAMMQRWLTGTI